MGSPVIKGTPLIQRKKPSYGQREVKRQPSLRPFEINRSNFVDTIHAIQQGIAVNNQHFRCFAQVAMAVEEGF